MHWTDNQVELLISLWAEGKTPVQIAGRLAVLGRDSVLEKIEILRLGRRTQGWAPMGPVRGGRHGSRSARQHSQRFRSVLAEHARRRAERRAGEDDPRPAARYRAEGTDNRPAGLLAALLAMEEETLPACHAEASALLVQRLRGWSGNPVVTSA